MSDASSAAQQHGSSYVPNEERRRNPRKRLQRPVSVRVGDKRLHGNTIEVSVGGIGVMLPTPLAKGTECKLRFGFYFNGKAVDVIADGKVMNCVCTGLEGFRIGMQLIVTDPATDAAIAEFLQ